MDHSTDGVVKDPAQPAVIRTQRYRWRGRRRDGTAVEGRNEAAPSKHELRILLTERGIWPLTIHPERRVPPIDPDVLTNGLAQLAKLVTARVPLLHALATVQASQPTTRKSAPFANGLEAVRRKIEDGTTLAEALESTGLVEDFTARLVGVGEATGRLAETLNAIAEHRTTRRRHAQALRKSLAYPSTVLVIALIISIVMMITVVPKFADIYQQFGADLPTSTAMVLRLSELMSSTGIYALGAAMGALPCCMYFARRFDRAGVDHIIQQAVAPLPLVGPLQRAAHLGTTLRTLAIGIEADVTLIDALRLARSVSAKPIQDDLGIVIDQVLEGSTLADAMQSVRSFPPIVATMIAAGEASGDIGTMLQYAIDHFDEAYESSIAILTAMAEPLVMVVLGGLVGGILIALYLPIFGLGGVLGGT